MGTGQKWTLEEFAEEVHSAMFVQHFDKNINWDLTCEEFQRFTVLIFNSDNCSSVLSSNSGYWA